MRAVVQRVKACTVTVDATAVGSIGRGLLVYLGVEREDTDKDLMYLVEKITGLRIFQDSDDKMNLSVMDFSGEILVVSQFTLCADTRKGKRPSYNNAAHPREGERYYNRFIETVKDRGIHTSSGIFGARMEVTYTNEGPVTILLDSRRTF
ncbi:MAG: D-aminoacyl-tRNA deacylase [Sediminispirochaetaceae bacterium]